MTIYRIPPYKDVPVTLVITILPDTRPEEGGDVELHLDSGEILDFKLDNRLVRVLVILTRLWVRDKTIKHKLRGARQNRIIRRLYSNQVKEVAVVKNDAMVRYVRMIRQQVQDAIVVLYEKSGQPVPKELPNIIETVPQRGYRIGQIGVTLIDYTEADEEEQ